jgi:hypothetical protein
MNDRRIRKRKEIRRGLVMAALQVVDLDAPISPMKV